MCSDLKVRAASKTELKSKEPEFFLVLSMALDSAPSPNVLDTIAPKVQRSWYWNAEGLSAQRNYSDFCGFLIHGIAARPDFPEKQE